MAHTAPCPDFDGITTPEAALRLTYSFAKGGEFDPG